MNIVKAEKNMRVIVRLISGISLILGILFDYLFYGKLLGINFPIFIILILSGLFLISYLLKRQIDKQVILLSIPLLFFATMVFIRTSVFLTFLNVVICLLLLLLIAKTVYGKKIEEFLLKDYIKTIFLPFRFIYPLFQTLSKLFSSHKVGNNKKVLSQVLRGVAMAIPIIFLFTLLFSSADLIFQKYLSDLITINIEGETVLRIVLVIMVTSIFIGAYSYIFQKSKEKTVIKLEDGKQLLGKIESSVIFSSINILFFLFILVQLTYLFGGESNISVQGFTYAEYARRGFFELITVAVLSLLLLLSFEKYVVRNGKIHTLEFKILSTSMIVQVIVIMVSAFTRLLLYERAYGFTTLRLYSHSFIILLAIIFGLLIYKIYIDRTERTFALRVFVLIILSLAGMNFLNPDLFIARQNIDRFNSTEKLDVYYLGNLSDDAIPEVVKLFDTLDGDMEMSLGSELYWRSQRVNESKEWQSFNIYRAKAKRILESKSKELEKYKNSQ